MDSFMLPLVVETVFVGWEGFHLNTREQDFLFPFSDLLKNDYLETEENLNNVHFSRKFQ